MALKDYNEKLNFIEKKKVSDGIGGWVTEYVVGAEFEGVFQRQSTQEQLLAQQRGLSEVWVLIVSKNIDLDKGDLVQFNGNKYRVTSEELVTVKKASPRVQSHQYQLEYVEV